MNKKNKIVILQLIQANKTQTFDIEKSEFVVGRGETSAIPIADSGISREHLKVLLEDDVVKIQDLNSSNGTYVENVKITPLQIIIIKETDTITFGKSLTKIKLKLIEVKEEIKTKIQDVEKESDHPPIVVDLSAFPKSGDDFKLSFKNVGLDLPKYKNPNEHAQEIIKEAEYIKHSIIKSAEVYKSKTINETKIQTRLAADEAYDEYQKLIDRLLDDTRRELLRLKTETEILLDEKRLHANEEIENLWKEHREGTRKDKEKQLEAVEKENKIKLELSIEKMKSDMFSEKHRLITDAENEIIQKKRDYQVEFENEKNEHQARIKIYGEELAKIQSGIVDCAIAFKENKQIRETSEIDLKKVTSQLKLEKENLELLIKSSQDTITLHKKIEIELSQFNEKKQLSGLEQEKFEKNLTEMNRIFSSLSEKKVALDEEIRFLSKSMEDSKLKAKAEVEAEYRQLKEIEIKKFDGFKINELKELQKIRDAHTNSVKKMSVDLSQEIATKIEMLSKSSGQSNFNFDKHFELINSVIQVKSAISTGSESAHTEQLDDWKKRKKRENLNILSLGMAIGFAFVFCGNLIYKKLSTDPVKEELNRVAAERKQYDALNVFVATKDSRYFDNYVDSTLYTISFAETYLDDSVQQEWVTHATKYFLRQWKVEEEKVIQVISNSRALVQSIVEAEPTLKKDHIAADIGKLKTLEQGYVANQAKILGTNVKYEAYKKLEKDFFTQKINRRTPANK